MTECSHPFFTAFNRLESKQLLPCQRQPDPARFLVLPRLIPAFPPVWKLKKGSSPSCQRRILLPELSFVFGQDHQDPLVKKHRCFFNLSSWGHFRIRIWIAGRNDSHNFLGRRNF